MSFDTFNDDLLILTFGELRMKCIKCGVPMLGPEIMVNEGPDSKTCFSCLMGGLPNRLSFNRASQNNNDGIKICEVRDYPVTLIGITGPARAGKNTLSKILLDKLGKDWGKASFADPIKQMLEVIGVNCSDDAKDSQETFYGRKARQMMQTLGTEWGRELVHPDIWVTAFNYLHGGRKMIVPDVRFENEADLIREKGVLIHLTGRGGIAGNHVSENPIGFKRGDIVIDNSRGLDWLESQVNGNTLFVVLASEV